MARSWNITVLGKADENSFPPISGADVLGDMGGGADAATFAKVVRAVHRRAERHGSSHGDAKRQTTSSDGDVDPTAHLCTADGTTKRMEQYADNDGDNSPADKSGPKSDSHTDCHSEWWSKEEMNLAIVTALLFALSTPAAVMLKVNQKQQLQVTGKTSGQTLEWVSSDARVATVINSSSPKLDGTVIGHKPGTVTITATAGTDKAETKVTVVP